MRKIKKECKLLAKKFVYMTVVFSLIFFQPGIALVAFGAEDDVVIEGPEILVEKSIIEEKGEKPEEQNDSENEEEKNEENGEEKIEEEILDEEEKNDSKEDENGKDVNDSEKPEEIGGDDLNNSKDEVSLLRIAEIDPSGNTAPVAIPSSFTVAEGSSHSGAVSGTDADGDSLTFQLSTGPFYGALTFNSDGSFNYKAHRQPTVGFSSSDSFTFVANDGNLSSESATISVTIVPVNDTPVANPFSFTVNAGQTYSGSVSGSDADGDALTFELLSDPFHGSIPLIHPDGTFTYTADADYSGSDSFTFKANDGLIDSIPATVDIVIIGNSVSCEETLIDEVEMGSLSDWIVNYPSGNPVFSYDEIVSPYDESTALRTSVVGSSYHPCNQPSISKNYLVSGNTDTTQLKAYLAFTSTMEHYTFPYVVVELYDEFDVRVGSQIYYGKDVIGGLYASYANNNPESYTELPTAAGDVTLDLSVMGENIDFTSLKITLVNYACVGQNSVTFDHLRVLCGEVDADNDDNGDLVGELVSPTEPLTVYQNTPFTFKSSVKCVDGNCGDVTATLDPAGDKDVGIFCSGCGSDQGTPCEELASGPSVASCEYYDRQCPINVDLENYNSILLYHNSGLCEDFHDKVYNWHIQDPLNRRLVISTFYWQGDTGLINSIMPFTTQGSCEYNPDSLGEYDENHALMQGISDFTHTCGYHGIDEPLDLRSDANVVAYWSDGVPFVVEDKTKNIVAITFFPGTSWCNEVRTQRNQLFYNALTYDLYKGVVPMNAGEPFYTTSQNPQTKSDVSCLGDMQKDGVCEQSWEVVPTGKQGSTYEFFTIYESSLGKQVDTEKVRITIFCDDPDGNGICADAEPDTTAPIITLRGDLVVEIEVGENYVDAGATAIDDVDGDVTSQIVVNNPVDVNVVGEYEITYDVSDSSGNKAEQVKRIVRVVEKKVVEEPKEEPKEEIIKTTSIKNLKAKYDADKERVKLSWDLKNDDNADEVKIYRSKKSSFKTNSSTRIGRQDASDKTFNDYDVEEGEKYYYKVVVVEKNGEESDVDPISIRIDEEISRGNASTGSEGAEESSEQGNNDNQEQNGNETPEEVLGEEDESGENETEGDTKKEDEQKRDGLGGWLWILVFAGGLGVILYAFRKSIFKK